MSLAIEVDAVLKRFGRDVRAVDGASLTVAAGEFVALLGPSGCGKTTLLRLIAGFEQPDAGTIRVGADVVAGAGWVPPEGRRVGVVFQDYALFPHMRVAENIGFGLPSPRRAERVAEALSLVGLDGYGRRYPHELSGGQQQRVALARALAPQPQVMLLDEPWSNIDPVLRVSLREELAEILRRTGVTVLLVTHEQEEAFSLADRIALMRDGRIVQSGQAEDIYYGPSDRWTAEFVGVANFLPGQARAGVVETVLGAFPADAAAEEAEVEVLVRPEMLELRPDGAGNGQVLERQFLGHDVAYRVRLDDGTVVSSQRPSNERVARGARVEVRVHEGRVAVFPRVPQLVLAADAVHG